MDEDREKLCASLGKLLYCTKWYGHDTIKKTIDLDPAGNTYEVSCSPYCRLCAAYAAEAIMKEVQDKFGEAA